MLGWNAYGWKCTCLLRVFAAGESSCLRMPGGVSGRLARGGGDRGGRGGGGLFLEEEYVRSCVRVRNIS